MGFVMMGGTNKCLKEWNATVEALGQGKQTILIRTYKTNLEKFLLYPTVSYTLKDNYLERYQVKHRSFVGENSLPKKENDKTEIKYYAQVEKIIEYSSLKIGDFRYFYIWTPEHIKSYLGGQKAYIWVLRVYKLDKPYMAEPSPRASKYANLKGEVSLEGITPVLSDDEFSNIIKGMD